MKSRLEPLNLFIPLEALTILSLTLCPAPWISTEGYPPHAVIWSIGLGTALWTVAVLNMSGVIRFAIHMIAVALTGLICLLLSFISVRHASIPHALFLAYGIVLLAEAAVAGASLLKAKAEPLQEKQHEEQREEERPQEKRAA